MCICSESGVLHEKESSSIYTFKPCPACNNDMQAWKDLEQVLDRILEN
jgi:hypothetical protein